jgi:hypothetical protein
MSEMIPPIPKGLDPELVEKISGGGLDVCSPGQIRELINDLRANYDQLVDFTSYVFDRIAGQ